jgi:hypothetical protein
MPLVVLLRVGAAVLGMAAAAVWLGGGLQFSLGPLKVSATDPARVALQGALLWLLATVAVPRPPHRALAMLPLVAVLLSAWCDSAPRRVGDGAEYLAMAINLSHGRPPALSAGDRAAIRTEMATLSGFEEAPLETPLVGAGGRQDFLHFWLYSLGAAPLVAVARAAGLDPLHAFTALNICLLGLLCWWLVRRDRLAAAAFVVASPLLWWIDKAHAEVFLFVTIAGAVLLATEHPSEGRLEAARRIGLALAAAALATAQNPGAAPVLAGVVAWAIVHHRRRSTWLAIAGAALIAAAPLVYYAWHLGVLLPLADEAGRVWSGARAVLTPLFDLNVGLVPLAPIPAVVAVLGARGVSLRVAGLVVATGVTLLLAFGATGNANHGGTPGLSRYALWILAVMTPLIVDGSARLGARRGVLVIMLGLSMAMTFQMFRPSASEQGRDSPSPLARVVWARWPALDNPLPEVFAERTSGVEGVPPLPATVTGCAKALLFGDGSQSWWPFPCEPRAAPPECAVTRALCYANGNSFWMAPAQPRFVFERAYERSWTLRDRARLAALLPRLGKGAEVVRLADGPRRTDGGQDIASLFIVEGPAGSAIWVRTLEGRGATLRVLATRPSNLEMRSGLTDAPVASPQLLEPGTHTLALPMEGPVLVLVTDAAPTSGP